MTGYGRVVALLDGRNIAVEAKSVNHRFLEISLRTPSALFPLEMEYKKKIGERFKRGRIDVSIRLEGEGADTSKVNLNLEIAHNYFDVLNRLKDEFHFQEPITLKSLTGFRDIFFHDVICLYSFEVAQPVDLDQLVPVDLADIHVSLPLLGDQVLGVLIQRIDIIRVITGQIAVIIRARVRGFIPVK